MTRARIAFYSPDHPSRAGADGADSGGSSRRDGAATAMIVLVGQRISPRRPTGAWPDQPLADLLIARRAADSPQAPYESLGAGNAASCFRVHAPDAVWTPARGELAQRSGSSSESCGIPTLAWLLASGWVAGFSSDLLPSGRFRIVHAIRALRNTTAARNEPAKAQRSVKNRLQVHLICISTVAPFCDRRAGSQVRILPRSAAGRDCRRSRRTL